MCQIHVKCLCTLNVAHVQVTSPLDRCHLPLPAIQVKHGINMALMNHFKLSSPQLVDGSSLSVHPIHLQIPNISHNIQKFQDLTNDQKQAALNLNQVVEAIKEERDTYHKINLTATETFLNKLPFSNNDSFFTMWQYISIFVITGIIIFHFILVFRVRKLFALIVSSSMVHTVESAELLTLPPTPISSTPPIDVDPFYSYYYLIAIITAAGSIFAFIRFIHFIGQIMSHFPRTMQYFRLCSGPTQKLYTSRLYVKIYGETDRVLLSLTSLETEPNLLSFGISPTITRISHKHIKCRPFLQFAWTGGLNYFVNDVQQMISLQTLIPIPFSLRYAVKNILSSTQLPKCVIIVKYRNEDNLIEIPTISIDINNPPIFGLLPIGQDHPKAALTTLQAPYCSPPSFQFPSTSYRQPSAPETTSSPQSTPPTFRPLLEPQQTKSTQIDLHGRTSTVSTTNPQMASPRCPRYSAYMADTKFL